MINIILGVIATVLVQAFALNVARCLSAAWTWLFTLPMPAELRNSYRAEVRSDVHEQISQSREEGHSPCGIAAHVIFRMAHGLKDDLARTLPYAPAAIADCLDRGSTALSHGKPNSTVIVTLAILLIFNFAFWTSQEGVGWVEWVFLNLGVLIIGKLNSKPVAPWVQKALEVLAYCTILAALVVIAWVVMQHRLYEAPFFAEIVASFGIFSVFFWGVVTMGGKLLRGHTIRKRGWAVVALLGITILGSVLAAWSISGTAEYVGTLWLLVGLTVALFAATGIVALICALLLWRGGTWAVSKSMRAIANTIRP